MKEFIRGEIIPRVNPGPNNHLQLYQTYLNYTEDNPANSLKFTKKEITL